MTGTSSLSARSQTRIRAYRGVQFQKGVTLLELMIVIIIVGILAYLGTQKYRQSQPPFRATALFSAAHDLTEVFLHMSEVCGTVENVDTSPLSTGGNAAGTVSFLLNGTNMNPQYQACVQNSGAKFLDTLSDGSPGAEKVGGFFISATMLDSNHIKWAFANVDEKIALAAYNKYSGVTGHDTAMALPAGDNSDTKLQFDAPSGGTTNLYFIIAL
jgi:prepilin-type N-terminal cleavage/methylation domain-containing protein